MKFKIFTLFIFSYFAINSQNVINIIIDGARYTETFGDPDRQYIPKMNELAQEGTIIDNFYNDNYTYTSRAVPALWCGGWTNVVDTFYNGNYTQYTTLPSIFEYFEKQKNPGDFKNVYVLKYLNSLWLQSFHPEYGEDFWPTVFSSGDNDLDVLENALQIMNDYHPQFLFIYLANVDHEGHSGDWNRYVNAISIADSFVYRIWQEVENDPFYSGNTTMLVTNDHGRHTNDFSGHGCSCEGCRHIMFLALGPNVKQNFISAQERYLPDYAVTSASLLDVDMVLSNGNITNEIFETQNTINEFVDNDIIFKNNSLFFTLVKDEFVSIDMYDFTGRKIKTFFSGTLKHGEHVVYVNTESYSGVYLLRFSTNTFSNTLKIIL